MQNKQFNVKLQKSVSDDFDARFIISASTPDRVGDTITPSAYDKAIKRVAGKLPALFNHDPEKIAGFWANLRREGDTLVADLKLATTNIGRMLKAAIDSGVPMSSSIGFRGAGTPNKKGGVEFNDLELLECSLCMIPAHPRAIQIAKSFGMDPEEFIDTLSDGEDDVAASGLNLDEILQKSRAATLAANLTLRKVRS